MGSFYSHSKKSEVEDNGGHVDDKKENMPVGPMTSSPLYPGNGAHLEFESDKTPQTAGTSGGLVCDPRSPNPEISRTPINVTSGKDSSVNPLKGKGKVLGFTKQNSAQ